MPTKRNHASGVVIDKGGLSESQAALPAEDASRFPDDAGRRNFLRRTGTLTGGAVAAGVWLAAARV